MGERCQDKCTLADYGICEPWIAQVHMPAVLLVCSFSLLEWVSSAYCQSVSGLRKLFTICR